ncbi:MAG: FKBP-type peptidyl-prolyl cis-trans isomerase [Oscillospiraceae bacterium]|jgi:trigger factor|nr:FKBP-type peptidyl-prolyl cis-trans isomerase [Oscillospiraceae bacterium]
MKKYVMFLFLFLAFLMLLVPLAGCEAAADETESESGLASLYSAGIDENGFWKGIKALDYVENLDYRAMTIPAGAHQVSDDYLQYQIDTLMAGYISRIQIMDRAVADGDTVNIDYEGKIDGVVFEGGSTMTVGVDVIIGTADDTENMLSFLDGFLEQLIGRMPGEKFDIEVTFPADYHEETLRNKKAVFATIINYIVKREELTDDFVAENLSASNGWTTVEEMRRSMRADIQKNLIQEYIEQFLRSKVPVKSIPDSLMKYQELLLLHSYQELADYNGMELEEYLQAYEGFSNVKECVADAHGDLAENAKYFLIIQAVAEDAGILVDDEDMTKYSSEHLWSSDIAVQVEYYGSPYVKQAVLSQKVLDYIAENAVLAA